MDEPGIEGGKCMEIFDSPRLFFVKGEACREIDVRVQQPNARPGCC
jgi:hypothetical protein